MLKADAYPSGLTFNIFVKQTAVGLVVVVVVVFFLIKQTKNKVH